MMAEKRKNTASRSKAVKSPKRRIVAGRAKRSTVNTGKPDVRVFMSYSHHDAAAQERLNKHLAPWRRDGVTVWYDENIEPGAKLSTEIARELRRAHIFVALFSPSYIDSHYCWDIEYKRAMGRRARKLIRVIAVVVKPCGWQQTRAAGFKLLPKDGIPPERWSSSDAAYDNVSKGIGETIRTVRRELNAKSAVTPRSAAKPVQKPKTVPTKNKAPKPAAVRVIPSIKQGTRVSRARSPTAKQ